MLVSGDRAAGSGRSLAAGPVQPRALSAPYTADFDASPCISCFSFASYNAVTSEYVFVEVGGVEPPSFSSAVGLLRAQPVEGLGRHVFTGNGVTPQPERCPQRPSGTTDA